MDNQGPSNNNVNSTINQEVNKLFQIIHSSTVKILQNVLSMQKMINQIKSSSDSKIIYQQLDQIQQSTQKLATDTNENLKKVKESIKNTTLNNPNKQKLLKMQKDKLQNEFFAALKSLQFIQKQISVINTKALLEARSEPNSTDKKQEKVSESQDM